MPASAEPALSGILCRRSPPASLAVVLALAPYPRTRVVSGVMSVFDSADVDVFWRECGLHYFPYLEDCPYL